ncbi:MAG: hypothetical protein ACHQ02_03555 [Candidatus Limnocylindrales bacterium]
MTRLSWPRRVALATLAAVFLGIPAALGGTVPTEARQPFSMDLYRAGDFVSQTNLVQCVGASVQMMQNVGASRDDRSASTQRRYWAMARRLSPPRPPGWPKRRGASVHGWAAALRRLDVGPYTVLGYPTMQQALQAAAKSMRQSGKPVGLLVWAGRHAWVMTGFQATADPLTSPNARITHVDVLDPLYPRGATSWGRSPRPGERLTVERLSQYFVRRSSSWSASPYSARWVIVATTALKPDPRML